MCNFFFSVVCQIDWRDVDLTQNRDRVEKRARITETLRSLPDFSEAERKGLHEEVTNFDKFYSFIYLNLHPWLTACARNVTRCRNVTEIFKRQKSPKEFRIKMIILRVNMQEKRKEKFLIFFSQVKKTLCNEIFFFNSHFSIFLSPLNFLLWILLLSSLFFSHLRLYVLAFLFLPASSKKPEKFTHLPSLQQSSTINRDWLRPIPSAFHVPVIPQTKWQEQKDIPVT